MSAPIGVLAAMSRTSNALARVDVDDILRADLIAARAAVAELIEAANDYADAQGALDNHETAGPNADDYWTLRRRCNVVRSRFFDALARIGAA